MTDNQKPSTTIPSVEWEAGDPLARQRRAAPPPSSTGSLAPAPSTPIRGGSSEIVRAPKATPADWNKWAHMLTAKVWEAVALSIDVEPSSLPFDWRGNRRSPFEDCSEEYRRLLAIAENHCRRKLQCEFYAANPFGNDVSLEVFADWARTLQWQLPPQFPGVTKAALSKWRAKELWSERELQHLCCGLVPDAGQLTTGEINDAAEAIRRAVLVKSLDALEPSGLVEADHFYGHARFFEPVKATAWAVAAFPRFPFKAEDFPPAALKPLEVAEASRQSAWPWGVYETSLLRHLADAAQHWWVNFDPSDNTTAPTNQRVSAWLQERGVPMVMADKMATILRADGVPTGPRT